MLFKTKGIIKCTTYDSCPFFLGGWGGGGGGEILEAGFQTTSNAAELETECVRS